MSIFGIIGFVGCIALFAAIGCAVEEHKMNAAARLQARRDQLFSNLLDDNI